MAFQLVVITPQRPLTPRDVEHARGLLDRGLPTLHVRQPGSSAEELAALLRALSPTQRRRCVLHQHHELTRQASVKGVHYREADRPPGVIRAPPGLAVSTSFHSLGDLGVCRGELDYCFLSPIYDSISKAGYGAGFPDHDELAAALAASRYPVLALGGITPDRFGELQDLGFAGAALLGAVWEAEDPLAAYEEAAQAAERLA